MIILFEIWVGIDLFTPVKKAWLNQIVLNQLKVPVCSIKWHLVVKLYISRDCCCETLKNLTALFKIRVLFVCSLHKYKELNLR